MTTTLAALRRSPFARIDTQPVAVKVPEITALFWVIKVTSTAMGEALADFLDGGPGVYPVLGGALALVAFVVALRLQLRQTRYVTGIYWLAVGMVATFGTMAADSLHQFLGWPYWFNTALFAGILAAVFWRWHSSEGTLSIHSIDRRRRERFYWATVMATFALGTAAGDWTATGLHLGFFSSGVLFAVVIVVPAIAYRLKANAVVTFWFAYVVTRPLGASFADWADVSHRRGGLGLGTGPIGLGLAVIMAILVVVMARRERAVPAEVSPHHWVSGLTGSVGRPDGPSVESAVARTRAPRLARDRAGRACQESG